MLAAGLLAAIPATARGGPAPSTDRVVSMVTLAVLLPSEFGMYLALPGADFLFGWAWQLPLATNHRFVGSVSVLPGADDVHVRGRVGYRYSRRYGFAGVGMGIADAVPTFSPEIGARFRLGSSNELGAGIFPYLTARGDLVPELQAVSVLVGWSLY